ncbi:hypothetical protein AB1Y20_008860 [Prymnesium parvum]|uniref:Alpha-L-arabinofuranosidase B catalytic domain-containing protein n=1 Tax=Prymnesium parvum TaxID=97485 RepID=A0AB34IRQ4_PRYPA
MLPPLPLLCAFAAKPLAERPCDLFGAAGTPCVAAHSTVRALYASYTGALYQLRRESDGALRDIGVLAAGGVADAAAQEAFCQAQPCVIARIYDQSPSRNHLGVAAGGGARPSADRPANASAERLYVDGHAVYSAYFEGGMGYRNDTTTNIAKGDEAQCIYMVTSGRHFNNGCCFDYGNAETDNLDEGAGTMEALYFGNATGGLNHGGKGPGPWIMADMENALWGANVVKSNEEPIFHEFVTAMIKGDSGPAPGHWAIKGGNAQAGGLKVYWDGERAPGYAPMKKQGAIILGIGGDNSNWATGTFYEGAMVKGYTSDAVDDAVQANIVSAGYMSASSKKSRS